MDANISLRFWRQQLAAILVLLCFGTGVHADEVSGAAAATTTWLCWYNNDTRILCRLLDAAADAPSDPLQADATPSAVAAPLQPTSSQYPSRGPLPPIVNAILERPETLRERTISIPLFTSPEDMAFAEELAWAVMCGIRATCRVDFERSVEALAMLNDPDPALE
jgi:hypothetical protein